MYLHKAFSEITNDRNKYFTDNQFNFMVVSNISRYFSGIICMQ